MKKTSITLALLLTLVFASAATLRVALDGTQTYNRIQDAINAAVTGDIVLVYPGTYYENLLITGKNITLASLEYDTGDVSYKYTTIIDGSQNGSVIEISYGLSNATVRGFTIRNGSGRYYEDLGGSWGGAFLIVSLNQVNSVSITNCILRDNSVSSTGGAISATWCNLHLSGVSIFSNDAAFGGGLYHGTSVYQDYNLTFDPNNRCSIYSNRAANGADILLNNHRSVHVVVDTLTVANPWNFYANNNYHYSAGIPNPFTFDILHTVHTEINADHYVAPWGDDNNDGLSSASPLKTIYKACYNIASDPDNPKTIHLANGYYSKTANQQFFPISVKSYCNLIGESNEGVIWDLENRHFTLCLTFHTEHIIVSNIRLRNIKDVFSFHYTNYVDIDEIRVDNETNGKFLISSASASNASLTNISTNRTYSSSYLHGMRISLNSGYLRLKNINLPELTGSGVVSGIDVNNHGPATISIDGLKIHGLSCTNADEYNFNTIMQIGPLYDNPAFHLRIELKNSAFYDNHQATPNHMAHIRASNDTTFVSNCTFADNRGGSYPLLVSGKSVLKNNIFWNPELNHEVGLGYFPEAGITSKAEFENNCIRGGFNGIYNMSPSNQIIWHDNNINLDPLFEGEGSHPYRLSAFSPLIDIGTEYDLPADALDAGGNERVWDGDGDGIARIDLGAYEYQPVYAPADLVGSVVDKKCVRLLWQMPDYDRSLVGFRIYRDAELLINLHDPEARTYLDLVPESGTYEYYVVALFGMVESAPTNTISITIFGLSNADDFQVPLANTLSITPNPFRDLAVISYQLEKNSEIELNIYNVKGQKVRRLQNGSFVKGEQILAWDGGDDAGRHTSAGVYFLQLKQDGKLVVTKKVLKY